MKKRIICLLALSLLVGCGKQDTAKTEPFEAVKAVEVANVYGDTLQDQKLTDVVYTELETTEEVPEEEVSVNNVEESVSLNLIVPEGLHIVNGLVESVDPTDFRNNARRYSEITDLSGNKVFNSGEALAYAEVDFVLHNDNYDGSRPLITVSENEGFMIIENDYKLPKGVYQFATDLPYSHLTVYVDGTTDKVSEFMIDNEEDPLEYTIRDSMYVHGNNLYFTRTGDVYEPIVGVAEPDMIDINEFTVSHNVVSYNKLYRR